jgi:redox-sensitive bicupin YhaK (pirin superfamily)
MKWFRVVLTEDDDGDSTDMRQFEDENALYTALIEEGVEFVRIEPYQRQMEDGLKSLRRMLDAQFEEGNLGDAEYEAMSTILYVAEDEVLGRE